MLESAVHYMKTLFHMLNAKPLLEEIDIARKLLSNKASLPDLSEESILQMNKYCDTIVAELEVLLHKKLSA